MLIFDRFFFGSDHAGYLIKDYVINNFFQDKNFIDYGTYSSASVDFPFYANIVCKSIEKPTDCGLLFCGSGIGMSIAANRHRNINAALVQDLKTAFFARAHNNCNVIVVSSSLLDDKELLQEILKIFLQTSFEGKHYKKRLEMISSYPVI